MNKEFVENLTMAYIYSYSKAIQEVKNPNFATQIAMSVIATINMGEQIGKPVQNPLKILLEHMTKVQEREGENDDREENEAD